MPPSEPPILAPHSASPWERSGPFGRTTTDRGKTLVYGLLALGVSVAVGFGLVALPLVLFVGAFGAVIAALLIMSRPFIGLLLYSALFVFQPAELMPALGALHLERVVGVLALLGMALGMYRRTGQFIFDASRQTYWFWAFVAATFLAIPFSTWVGRSTSVLVELFKIVAFYIMIIHLVSTRLRFRVFIWVYLCLMLYLCLSSIRSYYSGGSMYAMGIDRAVGLTSVGGNANELAATIATTIGLLIAMTALESRFWPRAAAGVGTAVMFWGLVLTGSRGGLLGCLAGLVYLWWRSKRRLVLGVVGAEALVAGFSVIPAQYKTRYETMVSDQLDGSSMGRVLAWKTGLRMLVDRPILGVGPGCFGTARAMSYSDPFRPNWLESHSLYIQVLAENGLVGAIAFFGFLYQVMRLNRKAEHAVAKRGRGWNLERAVLIGMFTGLVSLMVIGVFGHNLYRRTWYVYAGVTLAVLRLPKESAPGSDSGTL